jgi:hypothetical protein
MIRVCRAHLSAASSMAFETFPGCRLAVAGFYERSADYDNVNIDHIVVTPGDG